MMRAAQMIGGAIVFLFGAGAPHAGTFYSEDFSSGYNVPDGFGQFAVVPGWTITGSVDSVLVLTSADYDMYAAGVGDTGTGNFLAFGAGNSPDDGVATTPSISVGAAGRRLSLSFDYGSFSIDPGLTQSLEILVDGSPITTVNTSGSTNVLSSLFRLYTFSFSAPSPSITLTFKDVSTATTGVDGLLDNVTLSSGVPEPSTWAMIALGFAALAFAGCRRGPRADYPFRLPD